MKRIEVKKSLLDLANQASFDHSSIGHALYDGQGRLLCFNNALIAIIGHSMIEEIFERPLFELGFLNPADKVSVAEGDEWHRKNVRFSSHRDFKTIDHLDQSEHIFCNLRVLPLKREGHVDGYLMMAQEVTSKTLSDENLKRRDLFYKFIIEYGHDCVMLLSVSGEFLFVSPNIEKLSGISWPEFTQQGWRSFFRPEDIQKLVSMRERVLLRDGDQATDIITLLPNNTQFEVTMTNYLGREDIGGLALVFRDVTPLMVAHDEIEKQTIVIRKIMNQVETDKAKIRHTLSHHIEKKLKPLIAKLKKERSYNEELISKIEFELDWDWGEQKEKESNYELLLTPTESKICDYIREGASTKEIATALHTATSTVNEHKSNIRKKLKITRDINLKTFLTHIDKK